MSASTRARIVAISAAAALSLTACASSDGSSSGGASGGTKSLVVGTDLPLQGTSASASDSTNKMAQLYLDQVGGKAGDYKVALKTYDDSTAAKGAWDDAACAKNATDHVANTNEVAVMGTYNSGCAKIEIPTLNQDSDGPLLMVSHAATNPGMTKKWDTGEPDKYYPTGTRNFARVPATDDYQGPADATYAKSDLKVTKCYVLNDNQTYGLGIAKAFSDGAKKEGIQVVGEASWDAKQPNYTALFQSVKASGADCVFLGGIYDNNGGQLVKDKVAVLGDNMGAVKLVSPDGFSGYPDLLALPEAAGMYISFAGLPLSEVTKAGGPGAKLLEAYQQKYGAPPASNYALYGAAAMQVILAAIEKSDGTRKGVTEAVLSGDGIDIPASDSVTGKEIKIDPESGDNTIRDITIQQVVSGAETFVKTETVEGG